MTFLCGEDRAAGIGQHELGPGWPRPWHLRCDGCGLEQEYSVALRNGWRPEGGGRHYCGLCGELSTARTTTVTKRDGELLVAKQLSIDVDLCACCGQPIAQPMTGRRRRTCSSRCRQRMSRNGREFALAESVS